MSKRLLANISNFQEIKISKLTAEVMKSQYIK